MSRLAGAVDGVIGVDTHRDTLAVQLRSWGPDWPPRLVAATADPARLCAGTAAGIC
jgi:hypothetical protein